MANKSNNRGLDNAGKTTIVKRILEEDVNTVSPTLGFIIRTVDFEGLVCFFLFRLWVVIVVLEFWAGCGYGL